MPKWIPTTGWTSTETAEVMDLVVNSKRGPARKEDVKEDSLWLWRVIRKNVTIQYVVLVKEKPDGVIKMAARRTFIAYLVKRKAKGGHTPDVVKMLYLVPR